MGYQMLGEFRSAWRRLAGSGSEYPITHALFMFGEDVAEAVLDDTAKTRGQSGYYYVSIEKHLADLHLPVTDKTKRMFKSLKTAAVAAGMLTPIQADLDGSGRVVPGSVVSPERDWSVPNTRQNYGFPGRAPMFRFNANGPVKSSWTDKPEVTPHAELDECTPNRLATTTPGGLAVWDSKATTTASGPNDAYRAARANHPNSRSAL